MQESILKVANKTNQEIKMVAGLIKDLECGKTVSIQSAEHGKLQFLAMENEKVVNEEYSPFIKIRDKCVNDIANVLRAYRTELEYFFEKL